MTRFAITLSILLLAAAAARAVPVTFRFVPPGEPDRVNLAGSFNGWRADAQAMERAADGAWTVTLDLPAGPHQYKYVLDGNRWMADPAVPTVPPDGNNVVWAVPEGQNFERKVGDGRILEFAVSHAPDDVTRLGKEEVQIQLRTAADDVQSVSIEPFEPGAADGGMDRSIAMRRTGSDGVTDSWSTTISMRDPFRYVFMLADTPGSWVYASNTLQPSESSAHSGFVPFRLEPSKLPYLETPDWVRDTVWYQVFPERFHNGNKANDPAPPKGVPSWDTPLSAVSGNPNDHWWGGDLDGIREKLPYLKWLGVTGLYLNPIFLGPDTHFYATTDYMKVAPELGDLDALKRLVDAAHASGMRVMLDGVFNHTSVYHPAFRDILENQEKSRYKDWYFVRRWPVLDPVTNYRGEEERNLPYDGWWGIKWMPKLNPENPGLEKYLLNVATYWIREAGIDGWRLDVANEVASPFWVKFRKAVKAAKPDAYILGEIWDDASQWLKGDQFDSVMNYRFRGAVLDFFARGTSDAARFTRDLETVRNDYPPQATAVMFNLLGSHDTARFLTESGGDERRLVLATAFQMTYPGSPSIYYGDEVGMAGGNDPHNRAPMVWEEARRNRAVLASTRLAVALRNANPALRSLEIKTLHAPSGERTLALLRGQGDRSAITAFNAGDEPATLVIPAGELPGISVWRDAWRGGTRRVEDGSLTLSLPPMTASILLPATG